MSYQIIEFIRKNYCINFLYGKFTCDECKEKAFLSVKVNNKTYCGSCYDELKPNNTTYILPMPGIRCKFCGICDIYMKTIGHIIYCEGCFENIYK